MKYYSLFLLILTAIFFQSATSQTSVRIALLKYNGGGDWYANPTSLPNLVKFCNEQLKTNISSEIATIEASSPEIFNYPFLHMTGHGNVVFSNEDLKNLRAYLSGGGFLHIDDNYGMDKYIRPQLKFLFPDLELVELPFDHPVYHQRFSFPNGLPKIHEHDKKSPQGFGLVYEDRLIVFYSYECDLGDGWEDRAVHNDSEGTREKALKMGANLIEYVFTR